MSTLPTKESDFIHNLYSIPKPGICAVLKRIEDLAKDQKTILELVHILVDRTVSKPDKVILKENTIVVRVNLTTIEITSMDIGVYKGRNEVSLSPILYFHAFMALIRNNYPVPIRIGNVSKTPVEYNVLTYKD